MHRDLWGAISGMRTVLLSRCWFLSAPQQPGKVMLELDHTYYIRFSIPHLLHPVQYPQMKWVFVCLFTYIERRRGCQRYYLCTDFTDWNTFEAEGRTGKQAW